MAAGIMLAANAADRTIDISGNNTSSDYVTYNTAFSIAPNNSVTVKMARYSYFSSTINGTGLLSGYGNIGFKVGGIPGNHFYRVGDEIHSSLLEEGYRQYVSMLHDWYAAGLVSHDFVNTGYFFLDSNNLGKVGSNNTGIFYAGQDYLNNYADMSDDPDFALTGLQAPSAIWPT